MSKDAKNVPALRFKGYSDAWEKRKLGEVATITMGQSPDSKNYTLNPQDHILVQGNADIKNGWVEPRVWTTQITKIAKKGSVLLSVRAPVGEVSKTAFDVVLGRGVASVGQTDFLYQYLITLKINGFWLRYSTGSTFDSINSADIKDAIIFLPEKNEQSRIAKTLNCIDNLIAATQDKKKNLKYLRESIVLRLLDQDFNLINDSVPWKESRLGELVTFRKGRGYSKNELTFSGTPIILYGRLYTNYQVVIDNITDTFVKEHSDSVKSSGGDVIIPSSGETATDIARASSITRPDIILGGDLIVLNFNTNLINSPFLALSLSSGKRKSYLSRHAQGKSVVHLQNEFLASLSLKLPSPDTQARIAEIILQIDKIIVQYDEKVTLLQRLKKMLLQGLFI